jgi:hypothetical protein
MGHKVIGFTILALVIISSYSPRTGAMTGGTILTAEQERAGIFEIATYDGTTYGRRCTATVLYSSVATNRSWLVTAANCFTYVSGFPLYIVERHFSYPTARVIYDQDGDSSGSSEVWTDRNLSRVYINSEWTSTFVPTTYQGTPGIAFIRVNMAIPIFDAEGLRTNEFRRPIYTGRPEMVSAPYTFPFMENFSRNAFCGQGDGNLRCDRLSNLWWSPNFRNHFFQLPYEAWNTGFYVEGKGDEGGPLLKYAPGLTRQWEGEGSLRDVAMYGVVLGVLQAPTVVCDWIQNGNCNPQDGLASRFGDIDIEDWLNTINDAYADIPRISQWPAFFANLFYAGLGNGTNLTAFGQNQYTFPAYAGRIVGVSVDRVTDRLYTWYDDGAWTVGTRTDLDSVSQMPVAPDLMQTQSFSGPAGKPHSQIVAMMINSAQQTHTWYADGTQVIGAVNDLDRIQQPQAYDLPAGKSPRDIVAITARPAGGVRAYYRDGTFSEGVFYDLDLFEPPRLFQTGNGRSPEAILGIGTYKNGQTVTLFEHPRF